MRSASSIQHNFPQPNEASTSFPQNSTSALPAPGFEAPGVLVHATPHTKGAAVSLSPAPNPPGKTALREFLIDLPKQDRAEQVGEGKQLFRLFIQEFLQVEIPENFLQQGYAHVPDQIIIVGPHGSHLCVPVNILMLNTDDARALVQSKIDAAERAFGGRR